MSLGSRRPGSVTCRNSCKYRLYFCDQLQRHKFTLSRLSPEGWDLGLAVINTSNCMNLAFYSPFSVLSRDGNLGNSETGTPSLEVFCVWLVYNLERLNSASSAGEVLST